MTSPVPDEYTEAAWLGFEPAARMLPYQAYVDLVHDYVYEGDSDD